MAVGGIDNNSIHARIHQCQGSLKPFIPYGRGGGYPEPPVLVLAGGGFSK